MLLIFGIVLSVLGCAVGLLIAFASGMSDAPGARTSFWPAWALFAAAAVCFVARHYLHGKSITW